jgi:hypothetical protein
MCNGICIPLVIKKYVEIINIAVVDFITDLNYKDVKLILYQL